VGALALLGGSAAGCVSLAGLTGSDGGSDASRHIDATRDTGMLDAGRPDATRDAGIDAVVRDGARSDADAVAPSCASTCNFCTNGYCAVYFDNSLPGQLITALTSLQPLIYWAAEEDAGYDIVTADAPDGGHNPERLILDFQGAPMALANDRQSIFIGGAGYLATYTPPTTFQLRDSGLANLDSGVVRLEAGAQTVNGVAVDDNNVYWTDSTLNAVLQMPKHGGQVITLASDQPSLLGLASDSTSVYWLAGSDVLRVAISGGATPQTLTTGTSIAYTGPTPLVVHAGILYYPDTPSGSIMSLLTSGGTGTVFAPGQPKVTALATDGTSLYWTTNDSTGCTVVMQPLNADGADASTTIASFPEPGGVVSLAGGLAVSTSADGGVPPGGPSVFVSATIGSSGVLVVISPPQG